MEAIGHPAEAVRRAGVGLVIRGKRKVTSAIRSSNLTRKKTRRQVQKMNRKLIRIVSRTIRFVEKHLEAPPEKTQISVRKILETAHAIVHQQSTMLRQKVRHIADRIVSLWFDLFFAAKKGERQSSDQKFA